MLHIVWLCCSYNLNAIKLLRNSASKALFTDWSREGAIVIIFHYCY